MFTVGLVFKGENLAATSVMLHVALFATLDNNICNIDQQLLQH
jgi:hypothetical protein